MAGRIKVVDLQRDIVLMDHCGFGDSIFDLAKAVNQTNPSVRKQFEGVV